MIDRRTYLALVAGIGTVPTVSGDFEEIDDKPRLKYGRMTY